MDLSIRNFQSLSRLVSTSLRSTTPLLLVTGTVALVLAVLLVLLCIFLRYRTYHRLTAAGLPTVYWRPRSLFASVSQQPSSTITNILPRMKRLQGPYDMYGTVYGWDTAVIHVAHPVPALKILNAVSMNSGKPNKMTKNSNTGSCKAPAYNHFEHFCGHGVFTADGADWKAKRSAVLHALLVQPMKHNSKTEFALEAGVDKAGHELIQALHVLVSKDAEKERNVVPILQRATVGLIYRNLTHTDLTTTTITTDDQQKQQEPQNSHPSSLLPSYMQAVLEIRLLILAQSRSIWFLLPRWVYKTCSRLFQQEEVTMGPIRDFARRACQEARPTSPLGNLRKLPLYQSLHAKSVSDNLLDEAITLLFAGQDTSAATLSWTLHLLSLHPDIQRQLQQEVDAAFSKQSKTKSKTVTPPLVDAILKESMRLYPVAPFVVRRLTEPLVIPPKETATRASGEPTTNNQKTTTLPAGALACIWIYGLHHHSDFWENPNDFVPERWMDSSSNETTPGAYMPFAHGPRNCLGQPLAQVMLRTLLMQLVHHFDFSAVNPTRLDMQVGFTVLPQGGVPLRIRPRRSLPVASQRKGGKN